MGKEKKGERNEKFKFRFMTVAVNDNIQLVFPLFINA